MTKPKTPATVLYHMAEAFRAASLIPESVAARDAAWDFTMWLINGHDDPGATMPDWFGAHTGRLRPLEQNEINVKVNCGRT